MQDLIVENATILFKNFAGKEGKFNESGNRNFCLIIDNNQAVSLKADGWNIKYLQPREGEDEPPQAYLPVAVRFDPIPPEITFISGKGRVALTERTVHELDSADLENIDLIINPYVYNTPTRSGVKAYLKVGYFVQRINPLEHKYRHNKEAEVDPNGILLCGDCPRPCGSEGACRDEANI